MLAYQIGRTQQTDAELVFFTDTGVTKADLDGLELRITVAGVAKTLAVSSATNFSAGGTNYGIYWEGSIHGYQADDWANKTITIQLRTPNSAATGAPTISGTAVVGEPMRAVTSGIMDSDGLTTPGYTYQWIRVDGSTESDISGATSSIYTPVAADLGKTIKVKVSFTDDAGNAETLTSAETGTVTAVSNDQLLLDNTGPAPDRLSVNVGSLDFTQPFETGSNATGYTLTRIQIKSPQITTLPSTSSITVTLRADSSGDPASALATFSVPDTWTSDALNEFTLATPASLDPDKTYHFHVAATERVDVVRSVASQVDAGSASGWSFSSYKYQNSDGDWVTSIGALAMKLHGTIKATTNTYVSNINQGSDNDWSDTVKRAQSFTTGSQSGGYTVTSVDIGYDDAEGDKFSAAIWTVDSDNEPDDGDNNNKVADLTAPTGTWSAGDTLTFTAPAGTTLDAGTTYAVVLTATGNAVRLDSTTSSDEDSGAFAGWSIADGGYFISSNTWTAHPDRRSIAHRDQGHHHRRRPRPSTSATWPPATPAPSACGRRTAQRSGWASGSRRGSTPTTWPTRLSTPARAGPSTTPRPPATGTASPRASGPTPIASMSPTLITAGFSNTGARPCPGTRP